MTAPMSAEEKFFADLATSLQDLTERQASFKSILYGNSGVGKTVLSLQIAQHITPEEKWILYIDSGEGWVSLNNHPALKSRVKRWTDVRLSMLEKIAVGIQNQVAPFDTVGTVVIDEHSTIYDNDLRAVTKSKAARENGKDPDTPTWPDMNTAKNRTVDLLAKYIRLDDVNVILIAHERSDKDNLQREVISPSYQPKVGKNLREIVHLVGHLTADEQTSENGEVAYVRQVQVHPTTRIVAKTRVGGFHTTRVSPRQLVVGIKEWLGGERETTPDEEVKKTSEETAVETTDEAEPGLIDELI